MRIKLFLALMPVISFTTVPAPIVTTVQPAHEVEFKSVEYINEMGALLTSNCMVEALYPGVEKQRRSKCLRGNALRQDLENDRCVAITLNTLMGKGITEDVTYKKFNVAPFTHIIFDEIHLCNIKQLQYIHQFIQAHSDKLIFATGDGFQNKPIEEGCAYERPYYDHCVNSLFPRRVQLSIPKRIEPEYAEKFCSIFDRLKTSTDDSARKLVRAEFPPKPFNEWIPDATPNVTYLNNTAAILNSRYTDVTGVGEHKVLCKEHLSISSDKIKYKFYTNTTYNAVVHNHRTILILIKGGHIQLPHTAKVSAMDVYKHHFAPPNAQTCYSLQGLTIGPKINIFDTACPYVDKHWLITTLSRATTLDISIYNNSIQMPTSLAKRVESYKTQDINRFGDISAYDKQYITPAWIVDHLGNARLCIVESTLRTRGRWTELITFSLTPPQTAH
ncbi:TPA_asm: S1H [Physarum slime mold MELD virus]|nr:TPA_asm: S1H [Physarum slime mold MELD virus]